MSENDRPQRTQSIRRQSKRPATASVAGADATTGTEKALAFTVRDQRDVVLGDDAQVVAVRLEDGTIYIPLRQMCDSLGLNYVGQMQRIRRDGVLGNGLRTLPVHTEGGRQTMQCFLLTYIPYWVSGIEVDRVRAELRDRLYAYKEWVIARVYEAFAAETGMAPAATAQPATMSPHETALTLQQVEQLGLALATLARQQLALEEQHAHDLTTVQRHLSAIDQRLDRAAEVMRDTLHEIAALKIRLAPGQSITDEQASVIAGLVKAIAHALTVREGVASGKRRTNAYSAVFSEIYRRFGVSSYKLVKTEQFDDVIAWLREYQHSLGLAEES